MLQQITETFVKSIVIVGLPLLCVPILVYMDRKSGALIQKRIGPNRVGRNGLYQFLADFFKLIFKEDSRPGYSKGLLFSLAPVLALLLSFMVLAGIPICEPFYIGTQLFYAEVFYSELGVLYIFMFLLLSPFPILLSGWAANSKFAMVGAIRSTVQKISFEISLLLSFISVVLVYKTVNLHEMVQLQTSLTPFFLPSWGLIKQPIAAGIFFISILGISNNKPFDLVNSESDLISGHNVDYSGSMLMSFYINSYLGQILYAVLFSFLFLGGYSVLPGLSAMIEIIPQSLYSLQVISLLLKTFFIIFIIIWIKWSLPRFRHDKILKLGWNLLIPIGMANLIITVVLLYYHGTTL